MKPIFQKSRTTFEKIIIVLVIAYLIAAIIACNVNLDILVYAGFGTYVIIGLISFIQPNIMVDVLKKENEEYLAGNPKILPYIKSGFRFGGLALAIIGAALNYVFIVYY